MNKAMTAAVALLVALLAIQTYRLHQTQKDAAGASRDRPASEATAAGREELARAGLLLEDPGHPGDRLIARDVVFHAGSVIEHRPAFNVLAPDVVPEIKHLPPA